MVYRPNRTQPTRPCPLHRCHTNYCCSFSIETEPGSGPRPLSQTPYPVPASRFRSPRLARHPARSRFYEPWKGEVDLDERLGGRRWSQIQRQPDLWDPVHHPEAKLRHLPYAPSLSGQAAEYDTIAEADQLPRGEILLDGLRQSNYHSGDGNAQRRPSGSCFVGHLVEHCALYNSMAPPTNNLAKILGSLVAVVGGEY